MSFDEMYDELVHAEFLSSAVNNPPRRGAHAPARAAFASSRVRSIALVTSGGIAFAAIGAFMGGLGSEFAVTPAAAHALTTSHRSVPLAAASAAGAAGPAFRRAGSTARGATSAASGQLTGAAAGASNGAAPAAVVGSVSGGDSSGVPGTTTTGGGSSSGSGGGSTGGSGGGGGTTTTTTTPAGPLAPVTQIVGQLGLTSGVTDLTQTLSGVVGSVPGTGTATTPLSGLVSGLTSSIPGQ